MPTPRSLRTYPLTLKSVETNPINAGIVSAYDYAGDPNNAYAQGNGVPHVGTKTLVKEGAPTIVQVTADILGRDCSEGKTVTTAYRGTHIADLGFGSADGKGNFSIHRRYRTPSVHTGNTVGRTILSHRDFDGNKCWLVLTETTTDCYFKWGIATEPDHVPKNTVASGASFRIPYNTIVDLHITRNGDLVSVYLNGVLIATEDCPGLLTYNTNWTGIASGDGPIGAPIMDLILIDYTIWNRALSGAEVTEHQADPYGGYVNSVVEPTGTITNQPNPDGQNQRFVGTTTDATSGTYTLTGSNGGQTIGPLPFTVTANAFDFTHTGLADGTYTPTLTVTGSGGSAIVTGTSAFSIMGISGGGDVVSDPGDVLAPVISGAIEITEIKESSFVGTWPEATDNMTVAGYEYSFGGAYAPLGMVLTRLFDDMPVGAPFTLAIRAYDTEGLRSNVLTATNSTMVAQKPGAPTDVLATLLADQVVSITATPDTAVIDNPTTLYTVTASNGQIAAGSSMPIFITMPINFTGTFTVKASNAIGEGPASLASNEIYVPDPIIKTVSDAPTITNAVAGDGEVVVHFDVPVFTGNTPILQFKVTASSGEFNTGTVSPITVVVPNDAPVSFTAVAINEMGPSQPSAESAVVTPVQVVPDIHFTPSELRTIYVIPGPKLFAAGPAWDMTDPYTPCIDHDIQAVLEYTIDWDAWMMDSDTGLDELASSVVVTGALQVNQILLNGTKITVLISVIGVDDPAVPNEITSNIQSLSVPARMDARTIRLKLIDY